ncbi:hypothetical protein LCGC14_0595930 [marine sediment metagenome]|uniref:Uncharacterized protein n=1 Tax=marine sediment metagenome TaxID=412755 RepID=A0A0F9RH07_9ZZZZ
MTYLKGRRIIVPNINLKKFYRICAFRNISFKSVDLNEITFKKYLTFKNQLFGGYIKAESYSIFVEKLRKSILLKLISKEELTQLVNKPLNPTSIHVLFKKSNKQISNSSVKALLSLLMKVYLLDHVKIIKFLSFDEEERQDRSLIYYYLSRRRDFISVKRLKDKFWDHPRKHRINDYLLGLWLENKIDIGGLDVPRKTCNDFGFTDIPPDQVDKFKSVETYRVRETGELKARVLLSDNNKLYPLNKGD